MHTKTSTLSHLAVLVILGSLLLQFAECRNVRGSAVSYSAIACRKHTALLTDFGAVGDGKTLNTKAFKAAIDKLSLHAKDGGAQLIVPAGKWLTGPFNLTSHFTLFIHKEAVILASQDEKDWPLAKPLPSYGPRDGPGGNYGSLIAGSNLTDVVVTGNNGTIDGQGAPWWHKFKKNKLKATRPVLFELLHSSNIQLSNLTFKNSPFWHIHPTYCSNLTIQGITILAPVDVPNTDGINPDSCVQTRIEDCYIVSGDDCIAVKSGWDGPGIKVGKPTEHLVIRRLTCISPDSATVALGSEMSGGIRNVRIEDITAINTQSSVRVKTAVGRGGYVKDIWVRRMKLSTMRQVFWMSGAYSTHPADGFDPKALPDIQNINFRDIVATNVSQPGQFDGISNDVFKGICISNATITMTEKPKKLLWNCSSIQGITSKVTPKPCDLLPEQPKPMQCAFPEDKLAIENVNLLTCST